MHNISTGFKLDNGKGILYNAKELCNIMNEIEEFIISENYMNNTMFAKRMMMSQKIKANNCIEALKMI